MTLRHKYHTDKTYGDEFRYPTIWDDGIEYIFIYLLIGQ